MKTKQLIGFGIAALVLCLFTGCASPAIYGTSGLKQEYKPVSAKSVQTFKRGESVGRNYQIIDQIALHSFFGVSNGKARKMFRAEAARMGADAVIDIHRGPGNMKFSGGGLHFGGLAVKFLNPEQAAKPLNNSFIIARLPVIDPKTNKPIKLKKKKLNFGLSSMDYYWVFDAEFKGYYVLPPCEDHLTGLTGVKLMTPQQRLQVGGKDTQLLLDASVVGHGGLHLGIMESDRAQLKVRLYDKKSNKVIFDKSVMADSDQGIIVSMFENNFESAIGIAMKNAIKELPMAPGFKEKN